MKVIPIKAHRKEIDFERYKNPELARSIFKVLADIEKLDPNALNEAKAFIKKGFIC